MSVIRSISNSQDEILNGIIALHCPDGFECDVTYGNGQFYKSIQKPALKFDIDPQSDDVIAASSNALPISDESVGSVVFDPPFLTYVRSGREGNGKMIMAKRFAGYWRYDELQNHYVSTLAECKRVMKKKGKLVFKCQDIIHNHRIHATHVNVINWAADIGLSLKDIFILCATHRLPSPNRAGSQKHARIFHSYFLVFEK